MTDAIYDLDKKQVRAAFGRAAASYDAHAVLQREICDRMLERLDYVKHAPSTLLDAGAGTGYGAARLRSRYPQAHLVALDLAESMLQIARPQPRLWQRISRAAPFSAVCADIDRLPLKTSSVDMVWSNLALQWCNDLNVSFAEMYRVLAPNGLLMFSTFGPDTLKELRQAFNTVDGYSHVNRFVDMHDIGDVLVHAGFGTPVMDMEYITLTYADLKTLLQELKAIGAHNVTAGRNPGLMGRARWQALESAYEKFRREGRLPATYEVVYGHAWVNQKTRTADGHQIIQMNIQRRRTEKGLP